MTIEDNNICIIPCPPYPEYLEQPLDQSHCELSDCPKCDGKMWLSEKKIAAISLAEIIGREIILGCYNCIRKWADENPELLMQSKRIGI